MSIRDTVGAGTISTGLAPAAISFAGSGTTVTNGGGSDTITDTGSGNTLALPLAGQGLDTVTDGATVLGNGDVFDLRAALAATGWDRQLSDLGNYLSIGASGSNTTINIDPSGQAGGTVYTVAVLDGGGALSLNSFLTHARLT